MRKSFKEVKQLSYADAEVKVLAWWKENNIFQETLKSREDGIPFTFYEGPPTANGKPGIHHVMARTVKDLFCRYKSLKGYKVERKGGWDTHGLPVEIEVEKALGLEGRAQVEEYGVAKYNAQCRESVLKYKDLWDDLTRRMGYWVDLDQPYITFKNEYIESVWWAIRELYDKGLIYRGHKIQWYSPGNGTVLSSHEVSLGYKNTQDPSIYVKFPVDGEPDTYFLAWTTTPWTIVSNMALAVNPDLTYVKVRVSGGTGAGAGSGAGAGEGAGTGDSTGNGSGAGSGAGAGDAAKPINQYILAEGCLARTLQGEVEVVERMQGRDLLGKTYTPIFEYASAGIPKEQAWRVVEADFVTLDEGTGIVHMAPAYGADDHRICMREEIPMFNPIDRDGCFTGQVPEVEGVWFKEADKEIAKMIKERGLMLRHETYMHNYPFDWRKGTPLMSYPVDSWFVRTTAVKDKMVELNKTIQWKPASTGSGRFGQWLENNVDWAISRQRYWGTPIPIWVSDKDPDYIECIGSVEELKRKAGLPEDRELDLHRPYIDEITWPGPDGSTMRRIPDLLDVWFDSGSMPWAQWHYPFENKDKFTEQFPADFIAEGVDQTRGWFYTLHALATMLFDKPAYLNVVSNGLVLDENGEKMSKSKGNTVDPFKMIQTYGADVVRWYMMSNSSPWENLKFSETGLQETQRKFFNTIVNTYSFFALYANIDEFTYAGTKLATSERPEMDRWIISRLNTTIQQVDLFLEEYEPTRAAREIEQFVEELSNWYVRRNRRRFWKEGKSLDKTSAYQTLYECLQALAKLMSPIAPFFGEWLFYRLNEVSGKGERSVHLSFYPTVEETAIDKELEERMNLARTISSMVLRIRNQIDINVRQPLGRLILPMNEQEREQVLAVKEIILDEVNIKQIEFVDDESGIVSKTAKPNFPVLGKRLGKQMKEVSAIIKTFGNEEISEFEKNQNIQCTLDSGEIVILGANDLEILRTGLEGWSVETEQGVTVAVDTEITDELRKEGLAREFMNRVQNMRKDANYEVTDRIKIGYRAEGEMLDAIESRAESIKAETLAEELEGVLPATADYTKTWDIEGVACEISIERLMNH